MFTLRWRRNWKLVAVYVAGLAALVGFFGSARVVAVASSDRVASDPTSGKKNINGTVDQVVGGANDTVGGVLPGH